MEKVLIIRSSYVMHNLEKKSNLGDFLRTTVLKEELKKDYEIYWLCDQRASMFFKYIRDVCFFTELEGLENHRFDIVINLDNFDFKKLGMVSYIELRGFNAVGQPDILNTYEGVKSEKSWQQDLIEFSGYKWKEQNYQLDFSDSRTDKHCDIGFNYHVDKVWKSKSLDINRWKELENLFNEKSLSVSWQRGLTDFDEYIKWLASCELIVTVDSLGFHLANAMNRKVVLLVGPTDCREYNYSDYMKITPDEERFRCQPCNKPVCSMNIDSCLNTIDLDEIVKIVIAKLV